MRYFYNNGLPIQVAETQPIAFRDLLIYKSSDALTAEKSIVVVYDNAAAYHARPNP